MAYSAEAFNQAGQPGRGSLVGDFVPGKRGGWVPRDHPDAASDSPTGSDTGSGPGTSTRVQGDPLTAAGGGASMGGPGPAGPAMAGLNAAATSSSGGGSGSPGMQELAPQGASNPNLGQRIYPMAMRQLSLLPRIY